MTGVTSGRTLSEMSGHTSPAASGRPTCTGCGERIGVYERIWHIHPAGAETTSLLRLTEPVAGLLWHVACAEAAGLRTP